MIRLKIIHSQTNAINRKRNLMVPEMCDRSRNDLIV